MIMLRTPRCEQEFGELLSIYKEFGLSMWRLMRTSCFLSHSDNLSRTLQRNDLSAAESQIVAEMAIKTLQTLRDNEHFGLF